MPTAVKVYPLSSRGYPYSELSAKAQEAAREWWRDCDLHDDDDGSLSDLLNNDLRDHFGITDCELYYSLSYCQGDGVAFKGKPDIEEWGRRDEHIGGTLGQITLWTVAHRIEDWNLFCEITHSGNYCHEYSMDVSVSRDGEWHDMDPEKWVSIEGELDTLVKSLEEHCQERVREISRELARIGYAEIEYRDRDEAIVERIECNSYLFDVEGGFLE